VATVYYEGAAADPGWWLVHNHDSEMKIDVDAADIDAAIAQGIDSVRREGRGDLGATGEESIERLLWRTERVIAIKLADQGS
jgi:hypothetical protein